MGYEPTCPCRQQPYSHCTLCIAQVSGKIRKPEHDVMAVRLWLRQEHSSEVAAWHSKGHLAWCYQLRLCYGGALTDEEVGHPTQSLPQNLPVRHAGLVGPDFDRPVRGTEDCASPLGREPNPSGPSSFACPLLKPAGCIVQPGSEGPGERFGIWVADACFVRALFLPTCTKSASRMGRRTRW